MTAFEEDLRIAFHQSEKEIDDFFRSHFLEVLNKQMDTTDMNLDANIIKIKRQQTQHIKNYLINLAKKDKNSS